MAVRGLTFSLLVVASCHGEVRITEGTTLSRTCALEPEPVSLTVGDIRCARLVDAGWIRFQLVDGAGSPFVEILYDDDSTGVRSSTNTQSDVRLFGACEAAARFTPEGCTVELVSEEPAEVRVACPATLVFDGGDVATETTQEPASFRVRAETCDIL